MKIIHSKDLQFVPASHEDPKNPGVLKKILMKRDEFIDGKVQFLNWAKLPVGKSFASHFHEDMQEIFILTSGKATIRVGNDEEEMQPGDTVVVPPQTKHEMKNISDTDVEYIVFGVTPGEGTGKTVVA